MEASTEFNKIPRWKLFWFGGQLSLKVLHERRSSLKHLSEKVKTFKYLPIKLGINRKTFSFMFAQQIYPEITELKL